eukprot:TRINITY_DN4770_c0_g1_i1.p1 TRINITY_DN4770_c0_g1~~TRINITY_DN4770_c0_g1_i1.p1  ORF type:complete len:111 (+),score=15.64 TRINITY_DN4770_c0_g1_i1:445-777(+)
MIITKNINNELTDDIERLYPNYVKSKRDQVLHPNEWAERMKSMSRTPEYVAESIFQALTVRYPSFRYVSAGVTGYIAVAISYLPPWMKTSIILSFTENEPLLVEQNGKSN